MSAPSEGAPPTPGSSGGGAGSPVVEGLEGYDELKVLRAGRTQVYRARRAADGARVVIKTGAVERLRHEHGVLQELARPPNRLAPMACVAPRPLKSLVLGGAAATTSSAGAAAESPVEGVVVRNITTPPPEAITTTTTTTTTSSSSTPPGEKRKYVTPGGIDLSTHPLFGAWTAPLPDNEPARLAALRRTGMLDSPPEQRFDRFTKIAHKIWGTVALISLQDEHRQYFKSICGMDAKEGDRATSFCAHVIARPELSVMVLEDGSKDPTFETHPAVAAGAIKFYAGAALKDKAGLMLGTLCIAGNEPRVFSEEDQLRLQGMADLVTQEIEIDAPSGRDTGEHWERLLPGDANTRLLSALAWLSEDLVTKVEGYSETETTGTLILADGGDSLADALRCIREHPEGAASMQFSHVRRLEIAAALAAALEQVHLKDIVHLDIKPSNIIIDGRGHVQLIDFGNAIRGTLPNANTMLGSPAYMSPEQTGRTTGSIDRRADLYGLGVVLYELFTLQLPFSCATAGEFLQAHLARAPVPACNVNPTLPPTVGRMIAKLMSKDKEKRYQTAHGVLMDIERCRAELASTGRVAEFTLGEHDRSGVLRSPRQLWGREEDVNRLVGVIKLARAGGRMAVLIDGPSGVGKSSLVEEAHRRVNEEIAVNRLLFVAGKGEVARRVPYSTLDQAVGQIVVSLQMEGPSAVTRARTALLHTLGDDADILVSALPSLTPLLGPAATDVLPDSERIHQRFSFAVMQLMRFFATPERALALYIDDIQWCDEATVHALEELLDCEQLSNLLVICAYRTTEVPPQIEARIKKSDGFKRATRITIDGLSANDVAGLITDVAGCTLEYARELANICTLRTGGNPLHVMEVLRFLFAKKLLAFDFTRRIFTWDLALVRGSISTTGDVAAMVSQRMASVLSDEAAYVLSTAALLGAQFSSAFIAAVTGLTMQAVHAALSTAVDAGMVERYQGTINMALYDRPTRKRDLEAMMTTTEEDETVFRFLHDKIHEAALALQSSRHAATHARIGEILLDRVNNASNTAILSDSSTSSSSLTSGTRARSTTWIFEICNHLNAAVAKGTVLRDDVWEQLVTLNMDAAKTAQQLIALNEAQTYLQAARTHLARRELGPEAALRADEEVLDAAMWAQDPTTAAHLTLESLKVALQRDDHVTCQAILKRGMARAPSTAQKARLLAAVVRNGVAKLLIPEAIKTGHEALAMMGRPIPTENSQAFAMELMNKHHLAEAEGIEKLSAIQLATDEDAIVLADVVGGLMYVTQMGDPANVPAMAALAWDLVIERGLTASICGALIFQCIILIAMDKAEMAYKMSQQLFALIKKYNLIAEEPQPLVLIGGLVYPWYKPYHESHSLFTLAIKRGMELGTYEYVCYAHMEQHWFQMMEGVPLTTMVRELPEHMIFARRSKNLLAGGSESIMLRIAAKLMRQERFASVISEAGESVIVDEAEYEKSINLPYCGVTYLIMMALYHVIYDEPLAAIAYLDKAEPQLPVISGQVFGGLVPFLYVMAHARALGPTMDPTTAAKMDSYLQVLRARAAIVPANFRAMQLLAEAEMLRVRRNEHGPLMRTISEAISAASQSKCLWLLGLAHETAGRMWGQSNLGFITAEYRENHLKEAIAAYREWGAPAKAGIVRLHPAGAPSTSSSSSSGSGSLNSTPSPHLVAKALKPEIEAHRTRSMGRMTASTADEDFDAEFLLKGSQLISSELRLDRLLDTALPVVVEAAGAEHGAILGVDNDKVVMEAGFSEVMRAEGNAVPPYIALQRGAPALSTNVLLSVVNMVIQTREPILVEDAVKDTRRWSDEYLLAHRPRSVLCAPVVARGNVIKVLYMENNLYPGTFTSRRLTFVKVLLNQLTISLENAQLCAQFEDVNRTLEGDMLTRNAQMHGAVAELNTARDGAELVSQAQATWLATMADDLKKPMNSVIDLASQLLDTPLNPEQTENVLIIKSSSEALVKQVEALLDTKTGSVKVKLLPQITDVRQCFNECCLVLRVQSAEKRLVLNTEFDANLPQSVWLDPLRVRQIVVNLAGNAVKFTDRGSITVSVSARHVPTPKTHNYGAAVHDDAAWVELRCRIADTGVGMTPEGVANLFRPYEQVDVSAERRAQGTGLGLVISKGHCELMGGSITVESTLGVGSVFTFSLICPAVPVTTAAAVASASGKRILLVDDHHINLRVLHKMLARMGHDNVVLAQSGSEALALVKESEVPFDIIFLDIHMADMDGFDTARGIREMTAEGTVKIIALTADASLDAETIHKSYEFDDLLHKPVKLTELMAVVRGTELAPKRVAD